MFILNSITSQVGTDVIAALCDGHFEAHTPNREVIINVYY